MIINNVIINPSKPRFKNGKEKPIGRKYISRVRLFQQEMKKMCDKFSDLLIFVMQNLDMVGQNPVITLVIGRDLNGQYQVIMRNNFASINGKKNIKKG